MKKFYGVCDKIRVNQEGEDFWQHVMSNREEITMDNFLDNVDLSSILDDGETWEDYLSGLSDDIKFYQCNDVYFFQTAGFEFFWK
jgi:hypothetical protein